MPPVTLALSWEVRVFAESRRSCRLVAAGTTAVIVVLGAACGGSGDEAAVAKVGSAPKRAGDVWMVDSVDERSTAGAALAAYVSGLHVMVLDGDDAWAGMLRLRTQADSGDARVVRFSSGDVRLVRAGDAMSLRFADGSSVPMRRRTEEAP